MTDAPRIDVPNAGSRNAEDVGAEGNERLTAWAGAALLVGFGAECITLFNVEGWLTAHILIGIALLIPTGLKFASTMYRFGRYYTNTPAYVRKGPPRIVLRVIGPFLVLNTAFILVSGLLITVVAGPYQHPVEELHELGFWTWAALAGVHVLVYVWRVPSLLLADLALRGTPRSAAVQRMALGIGGGIAGCALALVLMPWVRDWIVQ